MNSGIRKYVSRYVVPFYYNFENNGYDTLRRHFLSETVDNESLRLPKDGRWVNAGFWENYKSSNDTQAEMDIYSYLPSILIEDEKVVSNLGTSFVYKTSGKLLDLEYRYKEKQLEMEDGDSEKSISFKCKDLGMLLFRNGIGFIWYETEFKDPISLDEYIRFQHDFKELARTREKKFVRKTGFDREKKEDIYESFCLGEWLSQVIAAEKLGIRFWAERKTESYDSNKVRIPDKALLFQYLFIESATDKESEDLVFRIANGYDEKYNAPDSIAEDLYKPFGNTCFYVSKAGMACIVDNSDSNELFFTDQFPEKYVRDYFFIYMLLTYQTYSLAHYSRLLTKLPADEELFNKQVMYADKLESLNGQINLFLVKSVFESVSNIHHQNGVYRYGKKSLSIEEDIRSLTIGLSALEEMEKDKRKQKEQKEKEIEKEKEEKRDRKINLALIVFGFMVVVSAWLDGLNLVDWFMEQKRTINPWHMGVSIGIMVLTLYLIITLLWNRRKK